MQMCNYVPQWSMVALHITHMMVAFSALTLLVGRQEGHPVCKNWAVGCWRSYLSGARCRLAYGPADATATLPFWYWLTWVILEKGLLNRCVCVHITHMWNATKFKRNCISSRSEIQQPHTGNHLLFLNLQSQSQVLRHMFNWINHLQISL